MKKTNHTLFLVVTLAILFTAACRKDNPDDKSGTDDTITADFDITILDYRGWKVDAVLSHTVPLKYEPVEVFMSCIDQSKVDKSTETWLDSIEDRLTYRHWYAGHYHTEKSIDKLTILFESIREFTV